MSAGVTKPDYSGTLIVVECYEPPHGCFEGDYYYDSHAYQIDKHTGKRVLEPKPKQWLNESYKFANIVRIRA
jgi:hypothetical protein